MRVVVAEDSALLRDGLVHLLERRGHEAVAAVADADALLAAVAEHRRDIAVVDVRMPPTHTDEGLRSRCAAVAGFRSSMAYDLEWHFTYTPARPSDVRGARGPRQLDQDS